MQFVSHIGKNIVADNLYTSTVNVSFGDCDPAGIVFYPRFFAWFDATFHGFLKDLNLPHARVCKKLEITGIGIIETGAEFTSPEIGRASCRERV